MKYQDGTGLTPEEKEIIRAGKTEQMCQSVEAVVRAGKAQTEQQADGDRITVEHLVWLLAAAQADEQPEEWQKSDRDGSLRRTIAVALRLHGWAADGIAGVIPQLAEMALAGTISLHSVGGAVTTPTAESISANQARWWMTADDAQRVLTAFRPGVRRYTITATAESIAKRVYSKDYLAEHALKTLLITEMTQAAERGDLTVNERRHGEAWVNECVVDEWLARERKPYRLSVTAQSEKEQADMERAGRQTIEGIAKTLAQKSGVDTARWEDTIVDAVKAGALSLKNPRNLADSLPYPVPNNLRAFYDRVDIADVNKLLDAHPEWLMKYRFEIETAAPQHCGPEVMDSESPANMSTVKDTATRRIKSRRNSLSAILDMAKERATNADDYHAVWASLVKIAQQDDRPCPLLGYAEGEGVKWSGDDADADAENTVKFLTKDALRKRLNPSAR
ncbi:hypothetical protein [Paraburkholderia bonniea]|uniref:hypothetical protein n=1 Tax=Paraburkholderia bonniea TaxID=2152891 RepID=UPI0012910334|nr:hypothetical protein [Paraburkholderia bonniea]